MSAIENENLQVADGGEHIDAAIEGGQQIAAEEAAASAEADGGAAEAAAGAPEADAWKPPTREEFEALKQHAQLGQKYAPYSQHLDQVLQQAFMQRQQPQQAPPAPKKGEEWVNPLDDPREYGNLWKNVGSDPNLFRKVLRAEAEAVGKPHFERLQAFEEKMGHIEKLARALEFHALQAPYRFQTNKDNEAFHKDALKALEDGKVNSIEAAYDYVRQGAEIKRLNAELAKAKAAPTATDAKAADGKPAAKKAVPNAAAAAKPSAAPRGRGVSPAPQEFNPKHARNWAKNAVAQAQAMDWSKD